MFNIMVVFVVSGLWHGANWTFVVWGFIHGFYLLAGRLGANVREKITCTLGISKTGQLRSFIQVLITFHLVLLSWIFFRAQSISEAWYILHNILSFNGYTDFIAMLNNPDSIVANLGININGLIISLCAIISLEITHLVVRKREYKATTKIVSPWKRYWLNYLVILVILIFGVFNSNEFIYFQF